jgi:hypothetical protein
MTLPRPSPGVILGAIALVVAMAGNASALQGALSIDGNDLRKNVVRSKHVAPNHLRSADYRNNSVKGADIDEETLAGVMAGQVRYVSEQASPVPGAGIGSPSQIEVSCRSGERAIGGGAAWIIPNFMDENQPTAQNTPITASMPVPAQPGIADATGWRAAGRNISGADRALRVYAICVPVTPGP